MFSALHTGCLHFVQIDLLPRLLSQFVLSRTRGFCTVHQLKYFWSTTQINQIKKTDIYPVSISFFFAFVLIKYTTSEGTFVSQNGNKKSENFHNYNEKEISREGLKIVFRKNLNQ